MTLTRTLKLKLKPYYRITIDHPFFFLPSLCSMISEWEEGFGRSIGCLVGSPKFNLFEDLQIQFKYISYNEINNKFSISIFSFLIFSFPFLFFYKNLFPFFHFFSILVLSHLNRFLPILSQFLAKYRKTLSAFIYIVKYIILLCIDWGTNMFLFGRAMNLKIHLIFTINKTKTNQKRQRKMFRSRYLLLWYRFIICYISILKGTRTWDVTVRTEWEHWKLCKKKSCCSSAFIILFSFDFVMKSGDCFYVFPYSVLFQFREWEIGKIW